MNPDAQKETRIRLFSFSTPAMRAFHMSWLAFFVCFFAWFAVAPLMPVIKTECYRRRRSPTSTSRPWVSRSWSAWCSVRSAAKYGPRRTYTALLALGAAPVLRAAGVEVESGKRGGWAVFKAASANYRVWMLFITYAASCGVELFVHDVAGSFGLLALFGRARRHRV